MQKEFIFSKSIKETADSLIEFLDLKKILSMYGFVNFVGSYNTNLMTNNDLDVDIITYSKRQSAIDFLNEIIATKKVQKIQFGDFENHPRKNRPNDYIVVLILDFEGQRWEVEVWFKEAEDLEKKRLEDRIVKLPEDVKIKIIKDKIERDKSGNKHKTSSFDIYSKYIDL